MSKALPFYSPTPRRLRRQNHPNLFLLGFSSKLILWLSSFFQNRSQKQAGRAGQGRQLEGRAGQEGRAQERADRQGRKSQEGQGGQGDLSGV